ETRLFNTDKMITVSMRSKEEANDYRYFPEPDLKPLYIDEAWIEKVKTTMPELPNDRHSRYVKNYQLSDYDAGVLTSEREISDYFEKTLEFYGTTDPKKIKKLSNLLTSEVLRIVKEKETTIDQLSIKPEFLSSTMKLIDDGAISGKIAKDVLDEMAVSGKPPEQIIEEKGWKQQSDPTALKKVAQDIIDQNPTQKEQYLSGKDKLFGFFVGQVMKETKGQANPNMINEILKELLHK
ncbi:MAG: Asp-tRNA(Asn)/Glu-tRNA(Gln) amidotransferase GatCAB subunit B, partial [Bdellovibrionales bacterium]|nr:Asp-tRNA(Asn)/Glu-tRNA(Gln) amidotransferase GatCAB subunit B [Bdellovibrionales bacterium]